MLTRLLAAFLVVTVTARKSYLVKQEHNLTQPRVQATYDCTYCVYKMSTDAICADYTFKLDVGWQFYQKDVDKVKYTYALKLYTQQTLSLHPFVNLPAVVYSDWTGTVDPFKTTAVLEFVTFKPQKLFCVKFYVDAE